MFLLHQRRNILLYWNCNHLLCQRNSWNNFGILLHHGQQSYSVKLILEIQDYESFTEILCLDVVAFILSSYLSSPYLIPVECPQIHRRWKKDPNRIRPVPCFFLYDQLSAFCTFCLHWRRPKLESLESESDSESRLSGSMVIRWSSDGSSIEDLGVVFSYFHYWQLEQVNVSVLLWYLIMYLELN